jgi:hypothetical protein
MKAYGIPNDSPSWRALRLKMDKEDREVLHPPHYNKGIETNDYIKSWEMSYAQGNIIKYVTRYPYKYSNRESQVSDLKKARWYIDDIIKSLESLPVVPNPYSWRDLNDEEVDRHNSEQRVDEKT